MAPDGCTILRTVTHAGPRLRQMLFLSYIGDRLGIYPEYWNQFIALQRS